MKKNLLTKVGIGLSIIIFNFFGLINSVQAENIKSANIYMVCDCGSLLTYKGIPVKVSYVEYTENGNHYPAYCMDKTKPGAETGAYTVSIQNAIQDVGLWRRIINGYPYKTIEQLGVANKEEAFTATKQAIYCYIHNNNPSDYRGIGEAGARTLNAMNKIISDSEKSTETKISSTITINKNTNEWKQDSIDKNYVSKTYNVSSAAQIENYKITITKENSENNGGIKLTDEKNQEKSEFKTNEKFKILIPIKNMNEKGSFHLKVDAKIKTKPILYGISPNSGYQDYALTTAVFEDGTGDIKDEYFKNETKIVVIKKDQESGEEIKETEFELLDENKNTILTGLKTNDEGKIIIENIIPGTYYLKETKPKDGYEIYEDLIRVEVELNEEITVTVNNKKQEKPITEITKNTKSVKKLPVTGM